MDQGLQPPQPICHLSVGQRLFWYVAVWLFTVLAFQIFLTPEGLTETNLSEMEQRIRWPLYTPIMVVIGFAEAFTWPTDFTAVAFVGAFACLVAHAITMLTRVHFRPFVLMLCIQTVLLAIAVIYFIRFSQLPGGP